MEKNTFYWLWYRGIRRYMGRIRGRNYQLARKRWLILNPTPPGGYQCALCSSAIPSDEFSLDHIIPIDAVYTYELDGSLVWSHHNLQATHKLCNVQKGNSVDVSISEAYSSSYNTKRVYNGEKRMDTGRAKSIR